MRDASIEANIPAEFKAAFQINKQVVFEVCYRTLGRNSHPYFATQAERLNRRKTDYSECGQCQERLPEGAAKRFWRKWDEKHLEQLSDEERVELWWDVEDLCEKYNHVVLTSDRFGTDDPRDIRFSDVVALSKQETKKAATS